METLIIFAAKYLFLLSIAAFVGVFLLLDSLQKRYFIKLSLLTAIIALALARIASTFYNNPRPFMVEHIQPLVSHGSDNGFPSDHTLLIMTIAVIIFQFNKKLGIFLGVVGLIVGIARVLAKVHHPIDILGSSVIAFLAITISVYLLKRYLKPGVLDH